VDPDERSEEDPESVVLGGDTDSPVVTLDSERGEKEDIMVEDGEYRGATPEEEATVVPS
jgi:hypothetical protein